MKGVDGEKSQTCGKITSSGDAQSIRGKDNTFSPAWAEKGPRSGWARPAQSRPTGIGARCMPGSGSRTCACAPRKYAREEAARARNRKRRWRHAKLSRMLYKRDKSCFSNAHDLESRSVIYIAVSYPTPKITNVPLSKPVFAQLECLKRQASLWLFSWYVHFNARKH